MQDIILFGQLLSLKWLFVPLDNALFLFDKWLYQTTYHKGLVSYG